MLEDYECSVCEDDVRFGSRRGSLMLGIGDDRGLKMLIRFLLLVVRPTGPQIELDANAFEQSGASACKK